MFLVEDFNTQSELLKLPKTELAKTSHADNTKPSKIGPDKQGKGTAIKTDKPVERKSPSIILKLPKPAKPEGN